jgi:hypothetical protein
VSLRQSRDVLALLGNLGTDVYSVPEIESVIQPTYILDDLSRVLPPVTGVRVFTTMDAVAVAARFSACIIGGVRSGFWLRRIRALSGNLNWTWHSNILALTVGVSQKFTTATRFLISSPVQDYLATRVLTGANASNIPEYYDVGDNAASYGNPVLLLNLNEAPISDRPIWFPPGTGFTVESTAVNTLMQVALDLEFPIPGPPTDWGPMPWGR